MSTLSTLKIRLSSELGDSETVNKTEEQRTQSINDACLQIYNYRNWKTLYENSTIQGVNGIFNIPRNLDKLIVMWYGKNNDLNNEINFVNQTDFFSKYPNYGTITEYEDRQVIQLEDDSNKGHNVYNYTGESTIGINDVSAREQIGQTFTSDSTTIEGVLLKLSTEGSPTGTLTINIYATAAGLPTGSSLASQTLNINELTSAEEYHWVKLNSALTVTTATVYAITITSSYSTSATDYVKWTYSTTSQITGSQVLYDGATWSLGTGDQVFVVCNDYYKIQYSKKFITMSDSTDDSGLDSKFDQAIAKLSAGILLETKGEIDKARFKYYGLGSEDSPTQNSAFGLLNLLYTKQCTESVRTDRRIKSVFEKRGTKYKYYPRSYYYGSN